MRSMVLAHGLFEIGDDHARKTHDLEKDHNLQSDKISKLEESLKATEVKFVGLEKDLAELKT